MLLRVLKNQQMIHAPPQEPSNVVLARISEGLFPVTLDALYTLFSFYGTVQKVGTTLSVRPCVCMCFCVGYGLGVQRSHV